MTVASLNLALLGVGNLQRRRRAQGGPRAPDAAQHESSTTCLPQSHAHSRHPRRATSHYNAFQTSCAISNDTPPPYATASRSFPTACASGDGREILPAYSCSVSAEGKLLLSLESIDPLSPAGEGEWREVYAVLRGTFLSFHRLKDGGAGNLLRTYTLQHAEIGLAPDADHAILVPQTRLANLIPQSARRRAWQKDPALFKSIRQSVLRLRVETDQILLADSEEDRIISLIYTISASIDISQPIDERSIPRQCTVPRRRRRARPQFSGNLADPSLLAEQERILAQMYPRFAGPAGPIAQPLLETPVEAPQTPAREEEEIDLSTMREENATAARPHTDDGTALSAVTRQTTSTSMNSTFAADMVYATPTSNFGSEGKWQPPHNRSAVQVQRYMRRCIPILLASSNRASDIVISNGQRMNINWRMKLLEEWELQPPSYKSHGFSNSTTLTRASSQRSVTGSGERFAPHSSSSVIGSEDDQISPAEQGLENLQLSKVRSVSTADKSAQHDLHLRDTSNMVPKTRSRPSQLPHETHGIIFCF